ncbi:hypothetical protein H8S00_01840 [Eubacterium sp. BX4]|uniref:Uncharacterized protein n=1 Tax=Eubacterium segne TaxID=2763045 RepID=A0ABR7EZI0_9FIRM|nr:hypothetical protein [Eubacterium segne]MBC5666738.1 hypothetical protein [Eubacterium segne]
MEKEIIIYFLQHSELETELWNQARDIRKQMIELQEEQDKLRNDIIYANQVGISISSEPTARTNNTTDISDVINRTERELAGYRRDLISAYTEILKKIETIKRVNLVYGTLLPLDRELIKRLYIDDQTWEAVEIDTQINHSILVRKVSRIFGIMSEKIDGSESNEEIALQQNNFQLIKPFKKKNGTNKIKGQKDIFDLFNNMEEAK